VVIDEWKMDKMDMNSNLFEKTDDGILVKQSGSYFIYSNAVIVSRGGDGISRCGYSLVYGKDSVDCTIGGLKSGGSARMEIPCSIGRVVYIEGGSVLKMIFRGSKGCKDLRPFKRNFLSSMGIWKVK